MCVGVPRTVAPSPWLIPDWRSRTSLSRPISRPLSRSLSRSLSRARAHASALRVIHQAWRHQDVSMQCIYRAMLVGTGQSELASCEYALL